ncbi:hypothetical protein JDV02_008069 [Purpureocillium takamizusanense]|uniref:Uncharacterized protein n=1 Tax=Purpureocillium takamizusanense TaxID=2060973 RepID=A0A9Q8QMX0_9HYPO|nr:uncharacterized protein JDV02_008069 [Purpureocillium takamizusanense]UNI22152.1 hypothetical protein JDV02_008069 [Purpureocillium takamizusanense]
MASSLSPDILLISLNSPPWFDEMYGPLLTALGTKAHVTRAETAKTAVHALARLPPPSAVLVTDEALTLAANRHVWLATVGYVCGGGTAVVAAMFPSFVQPDSIQPFFAQAGVPWGRGSYHRTTLTLDKAVVGDDVAATKLPSAYSQKAVFVSNVAPADAWYKPDDDDDPEVESSGFFSSGSSASVGGETAVALTRVGAGKLGYVGDVNAETGSDVVILAMCGLA